jgi:transposase
MAKPTTITAGIDTAKDKLDAAIHGMTVALNVPNDKAGHKKLAAAFAKHNVTRVGIEATGGYERGVVRHLQAAGLDVFVLQPLQVKRFGQMRLRRAKTDRIDAQLIAACTVTLDPQTQAPPEQRFDALADHLTFIEQIEEDKARCKTRLEHITDTRLRAIVLADIARLEKRRASELARLAALVREHDDLARKFDLVLSVPGIGERTALALIVRMPELGDLTREQAAALAGLAPFVHQSGKQAGETRRSLYAAALPAATRWNPACKALYERMVARGKKPVSALVACARKLLVFANTVVQRGTPWEAETAGG